jgi:general nucleoside transport system permease protein
MVGINEVLGYRYRYYDGFSDNYGFTGIAVALLGRNHPGGVVLAALLFAVLQRGGVPVDAFTRLVSKDIVQILQALVILFVAAEAMFRWKWAVGSRQIAGGGSAGAPSTAQAGTATVGKI